MALSDDSSDLSSLASTFAAVGPISETVDKLGPFPCDPDEEAVNFLRETNAERFIDRYDPDGSASSAFLLGLLGVAIPAGVEEAYAVRLLRRTMHHIRMDRLKLPQYNTIEDVQKLLRKSRKIMVITGAGISVSCGIPDFRSPQGLYARLQREGKYELDDPQQMFDIEYFKLYPEVFYSFASQIYPSNFIPSPCHRFVKLLENRGQLLRNYTQNIDTLETLTGVKRVFQCHGSFATASCIVCRTQVPGSEIKDAIFSHTVPFCAVCTKRTAAFKGKPKPKAKKKDGNGNGGASSKSKGKRKSGWDDEEEAETTMRHLMKPDITFFGEKLSSKFDHYFKEDLPQVDLLLVIGTSLAVAPVAEIVHRLPHSVPQIVINKTMIGHARPDIVLLGDADEIIEYLCQSLKWTLPPPLPASPSSGPATPPLAEPNMAGHKEAPKGVAKAKSTGEPQAERKERPSQVGSSHIWAFPGADARHLVDLSNSMSEDHPKPQVKVNSRMKRARAGSGSSSLSSLSSLDAWQARTEDKLSKLGVASSASSSSVGGLESLAPAPSKRARWV